MRLLRRCGRGNTEKRRPRVVVVSGIRVSRDDRHPGAVPVVGSSSSSSSNSSNTAGRRWRRRRRRLAVEVVQRNARARKDQAGSRAVDDRVRNPIERPVSQRGRQQEIARTELESRSQVGVESSAALRRQTIRPATGGSRGGLEEGPAATHEFAARRACRRRTGTNSCVGLFVIPATNRGRRNRNKHVIQGGILKDCLHGTIVVLVDIDFLVTSIVFVVVGSVVGTAGFEITGVCARTVSGMNPSVVVVVVLFLAVLHAAQLLSAAGRGPQLFSASPGHDSRGLLLLFLVVIIVVVVVVICHH
mmetsp:Transcript_102756/g.209361  ORF Transcript_102756/g.209361 Transcript_102756/m.209361 type:complete len:303 (-) Transcript_102756:5-913(-)